jgi:hypothetical protein
VLLLEELVAVFEGGGVVGVLEEVGVELVDEGVVEVEEAEVVDERVLVSVVEDWDDCGSGTLAEKIWDISCR